MGPDYKWILKSKTIWIAITYALVVAYDTQIQEWISTHPGWASASVSFVVVVLRLITKTGLKL